MTPNRFSPVLPAILALVAGISISYAQTIEKVQGHIKARSGALLIVQTTDSGKSRSCSMTIRRPGNPKAS